MLERALSRSDLYSGDMTMQYDVKRVRKELHRDLAPIFASAFGSVPSPEALRAKHDTEYTGSRDLGFLAYAEDGVPAGYYGVFPTRVRVGGSVLLAAQSGDTMVHRAHGRRGLFTTLARATYELCAAENVVGVFGFPSASSYPGFVKKLGWAHNEDIRRYQFLVPTVPLAEVAAHFKPLQRTMSWWQNLLLRVFPKGDFFRGGILEAGQDGVERDEAYWNYKLRSPRVQVARIGGVDVILKFEGKLGVGDVDCQDTRQLRRVLFRLRLYCFLAGINRIAFYVSPGTPLDLMLGELGRADKGLPIGFLNLDAACDLSGLKFCYFDMDTY